MPRGVTMKEKPGSSAVRPSGQQPFHQLFAPDLSTVNIRLRRTLTHMTGM